MEHAGRNITINPSFFGATDYTVFVLTLSISAFIGVYFGFIKKSSGSTEEYLLGGRQMKTLPIAISLIASQLSGITIMTIPAEMYFFGTQYYLIAISMVVICAAINYIFLPVFYENNISNCNEYLEYRFSPTIRKIITALYIVTSILVAPVTIYIPSLAFAQATGVNVHLINGVVCSVGVFYTCIGGIKAVVWTDVIQAGIMLGSSLLICVVGVAAVGGLSSVWEIAADGNRLELFNMNVDLTSRTTFWSSSIGYSLAWLTYVGLNQNCVQRMVAVPSMKHARNAMWLFAAGFFLITSLTCFTGLLIYAHYHVCDPLDAGLIKKPDQILPFFVQDVVGHLKGIPGLFNSCVFSAGLSTISAIMNAVAGVIYQDYIRPLRSREHSEADASIWIKGIVVAIGVYCILMEFVVAMFPNMLDLVYSLSAVFQGPALGVFTLGMFYPWANRKGALCGTIVSVLSLVYITSGNLLAKMGGEIHHPSLPTSIDGCVSMGINVTEVNNFLKSSAAPMEQEQQFSVHHIAFTWYTALGGLIVWLIAIPTSAMLKDDSEAPPNPSLLAPFIRKIYSSGSHYEGKKEMQLTKVINSVSGDNVEQTWVAKHEPESTKLTQ